VSMSCSRTAPLGENSWLTALPLSHIMYVFLCAKKRSFTVVYERGSFSLVSLFMCNHSVNQMLYGANCSLLIILHYFVFH
jgi:hypothetical protein